MSEIFYVHLYAEAAKMLKNRPGEVKTLTDGYRHAMYAFVTSFDPKSPHYVDKTYEQYISQLYNAYNTQVASGTISFDDYIKLLNTAFVPCQFANEMNKEQKALMVKQSLVNVITKYTKSVAKKCIVTVIDMHKDAKRNYAELQDLCRDILIEEREITYGKFLMAHNGEKTGKDMVDRSMVKKIKEDADKEISGLRTMLQKLTMEKEALEKEVDKLSKSNKELDAMNKQLNSQYTKNERAVKDAERAVSSMQDKMEENNKKLASFQSSYDALKTENEQLSAELKTVKRDLATLAAEKRNEEAPAKKSVVINPTPIKLNENVHSSSSSDNNNTVNANTELLNSEDINYYEDNNEDDDDDIFSSSIWGNKSVKITDDDIGEYLDD